MSEPLAIEPQQAPAEGSPATAATGFGYALAQARVRAGLSVEQAAGRLRLHPKQLRAIEAEELQALPAPAYVNGFVRNYARELGMDPGPLIEDLNAKLKLRGLVDNPPDLGSAGAVHARVLDDRAWRHLVVAGIVFALICAGLNAQQGITPPHTHLKVGDMAPDFTLPATTGGTIHLADFRGKSNVVLAFFPAAFTGG